MSRSRPFVSLTSLAALVALAACGGDQKPAADQTPSATTAPAAAAGAPVTPDAGGKVITVELISDGTGNFFKPSVIHAKRGDVVRYTLKVGVHNVHFLPDSNKGRSGYPQAPSDLLQLPGQTWDVAVKMPVGSYYFQCDPHALLGMKGTLIVE